MAGEVLREYQGCRRGGEGLGGNRRLKWLLGRFLAFGGIIVGSRGSKAPHSWCAGDYTTAIIGYGGWFSRISCGLDDWTRSVAKALFWSQGFCICIYQTRSASGTVHSQCVFHSIDPIQIKMHILPARPPDVS